MPKTMSQSIKDEVKEMSFTDLNSELKDINNHILKFSYGKFELYYRAQLEKEIGERKEVKYGMS